ncbi:MAG: hypothetical protein ACK4NR_09445 [Micavibrio sp.]
MIELEKIIIDTQHMEFSDGETEKFKLYDRTDSTITLELRPRSQTIAEAIFVAACELKKVPLCHDVTYPGGVVQTGICTNLDRLFDSDGEINLLTITALKD